MTVYFSGIEMFEYANVIGNDKPVVVFHHGMKIFGPVFHKEGTELMRTLLSRLKRANEEIQRLTLLLQVNGKEEVLSQSSSDSEKGKGEEQVVQEAEGAKEGEEIKEG
jgi:hypothetical protein